MTRAPLSRVLPGQVFAPLASEHNAFIDAALAARGGRLTSRGGGNVAREAGVITVRNTTGSSLPRRGVVGLGEPVFDADSDDGFVSHGVMMDARVPTAADTGRIAVMLRPVSAVAGALGPALLVGAVAVRVLIASPSHTHADVIDGDVTRLTSAAAGAARILWRGADSGEAWCIVLLGGGGGGGMFLSGVVTAASHISPAPSAQITYTCEIGDAPGATGVIVSGRPHFAPYADAPSPPTVLPAPVGSRCGLVMLPDGTLHIGIVREQLYYGPCS